MSDFNPINISIAIYLCWYEMEKSLIYCLLFKAQFSFMDSEEQSCAV